MYITTSVWITHSVSIKIRSVTSSSSLSISLWNEQHPIQVSTFLTQILASKTFLFPYVTGWHIVKLKLDGAQSLAHVTAGEALYVFSFM